METEILSQLPTQNERKPVGVGLDFLWLELTNRCNLQCVHCYTESGPQTGGGDRLTSDDYLSVMAQAYALGCRKMQFIGGEPTLHHDFQRLLEASKEIGFDFVEVFTNLTHLEEKTVQFARSANIHFATSVYSDKPEVHGGVTRNRTSHARTVENLKRLVDNEIETRAAVIQIDQTSPEIESTKRFLTDLGVRHVRSSYVRAFGRGEELRSQPSQMSELCGHCWAGRLCVAPDGEAYPCVMARQWPVGNVLDTALADIVRGVALQEIRTTIHETVWLPQRAAGRTTNGHAAEGEPDEDGETQSPDEDEKPACPQSCHPCPQSCTPSCDPSAERCTPDGEEEDQKLPACPQSCHPCPQSCTPSCDPSAQR